jgi:hypothetical protein
MTQKSLTYVVIAVAVGYSLISAIPRQVAIYSSPQMLAPSLIEYTSMRKLMKWWILDAFIALMIYWIAKRTRS